MMRRFAGASGFVITACMTLTAWPPMKTVAERGVAESFCAIVKVALPLPEPEPVRVIQPIVDKADHVQPACVVTPIVPVAVPPATISDAGDSV